MPVEHRSARIDAVHPFAAGQLDHGTPEKGNDRDGFGFGSLPIQVQAEVFS